MFPQALFNDQVIEEKLNLCPPQTVMRFVNSMESIQHLRKNILYQLGSLNSDKDVMFLKQLAA